MAEGLLSTQRASTKVEDKGMRLRLATRDDIPGLMEIVRAVVPAMRASGNLQWNDDYPNPEVFALDIEADHLWVAEIDGRVAGVIALTGTQDAEYADADWDISQPAVVIHRLAVHPRHHGQGIAAALLYQAEEVARQRRVLYVRLDTNTRNEATQKLLPKLGYRSCGEINLKIRPGLRFLCYEKQISSVMSE